MSSPDLCPIQYLSTHPQMKSTTPFRQLVQQMPTPKPAYNTRLLMAGWIVDRPHLWGCSLCERYNLKAEDHAPARL